LVRKQAAALFDAGGVGAEPTPRSASSEASWQAANASMDAHGGYGFAEDDDIERKFRETRLYITRRWEQSDPVDIGQHVSVCQGRFDADRRGSARST